MCEEEECMALFRALWGEPSHVFVPSTPEFRGRRGEARRKKNVRGEPLRVGHEWSTGVVYARVDSFPGLKCVCLEGVGVCGR